MTGRIVEGYWDCKYCGKKDIGGLTKECPNCGNPQDLDVKFNLRKEKKYLDEETAKNYGKGADWICSHCGSLNRYYKENCIRCGSLKEDSKENYFDHKLNNDSNNEDKEDYSSNRDNESNYTFKENIYTFLSNKKIYLDKPSKLCKYITYSIMPIIAIFFMIVLLIPRTYSATIESSSWKREIEIEEYKTLKESDWSVPPGGRTYRQSEEIYTYNQVIDHYENVTKQKSRQVLDHYEYTTYYTYSDNGDGTFTEHKHTNSSPVYVTEYYTVTEPEPVYKLVPVYKTKYYYEIERWVYNRTEKSSGKNNYEPYWPKYSLSGTNERVSNKSETYTLVFRTKNKKYKTNVSEKLWREYTIESDVNITVVAGTVTKINNKKVK